MPARASKQDVLELATLWYVNCKPRTVRFWRVWILKKYSFYWRLFWDLQGSTVVSTNLKFILTIPCRVCLYLFNLKANDFKLRLQSCNPFKAFKAKLFLEATKTRPHFSLPKVIILAWSTQQASSMILRDGTSLMSTPLPFWTCIITLGKEKWGRVFVAS